MTETATLQSAGVREQALAILARLGVPERALAGAGQGLGPPADAH